MLFAVFSMETVVGAYFLFDGVLFLLYLWAGLGVSFLVKCPLISLKSRRWEHSTGTFVPSFLLKLSCHCDLFL